VITWQTDGPYEVVFSTRVGGVSHGPFESLNIGLLTDDEPENVQENRRRLCAEVGADEERLTMNLQVHGAVVHRAVAGKRGEPGDGLWTDERHVPLVAVTADCLPVALARTNGNEPRLAVLHIGRLGLLEGIVERGVAQIGNASAVIGPGIGPCCYEVGDDIRADYRAAATSTSGPPPSARSAKPAWSTSSAPTSARRAIPSCSSPTVATAASRAGRE
jgi:copper oxidase (laccase) domain-containing protein